MATYKERYEELFGSTPAYDPITVPEPQQLAERAKRRAIKIQDNAPDAGLRRAIPVRDFDPAREEQGAISGLFKTGIAKGVAEPYVGAVEYGARQSGMQGVASDLKGVRGDMAAWRESVYARMDPEVMDMVGRELLTLDPTKTIWRGGPLEVAQAVAYKVVEQTPSLLSTLVPGALMMRFATLSKGVQFLGASEAGLSLGAIQNDIADGISQTDTQELMDGSYRFRQLMDEYGDEAQARDQLISEAQGMAPLIGGIAVGAISAAAGRYLAPVFTEKAGLGFGQRVGRAAISEGFLQEGPQESVEQIAGNIAAAVYDEDREMLEGVAESYAQGALLGSIMGGGVGGLLGRGPREETPPELDQPDAPSAFEREYGFRGGPSGPQGSLPLKGGSAPDIGVMGRQGELFDVPDELFDEQGNYVGNVAAKAAAERNAPQIDPGMVPPDVAAAVSANIRADQKMDDMFQTNVPYQQPYPSQNIQTEMFPTAAPTGGLPALNTRPVAAEDPLAPEQQEMLPDATKRTVGNRPIRTAGGGRELSVPRRDLSGAVTRTMPDVPMPEPEVDISAQMDQLSRGMRDGVYLASEQEVDPSILGDFPIIQDFDGRGGDVIFRDEETAEYWQDRIDNSAPEDLQAILGEITGAGTGKPIDGRLAIQQVNDLGGVSRETLVSTLEEARQVRDEWGAEAKEANETIRVLTAEEAVARRQQQAVGDMFAEPEPQVEGETGGTPRKLAGRHRVRFVDDTGAVIEDRTFSDVKRATKYADQLADEYGLLEPDAAARITVTPVRTLPKRQTRPTQDEQRAELAAKKKKAEYQTEGERLASKVRSKVEIPFEERSEMAQAVTPAKDREEAAKNLLRLAAKKLESEKEASIGGLYPPDVLTFKESTAELDEGELTPEQEYRNLWDELVAVEQELYATDFIVKNKSIVPLADRGAVVAKANRDHRKAIRKKQELVEKAERALLVASPKRRVEKVFREARLTNDEIVQLLTHNGNKIAELLGVENAALQSDFDEIIAATQTIGEEFGSAQLPVDEGEPDFNAAQEELSINAETTEESLKELSDAELSLAFEDSLRWRQRESKRLTPADINDIRTLSPSRSLKIKQIMRAVRSMINSSESDARVKGAKIVTNVQNADKGRKLKPTVVRTGALTSVTVKEESKADIAEREAAAEKLYAEMEENLRAAWTRVQNFYPDYDEDGALTEEGTDQIMGLFWADELIQLAGVIWRLRRTDQGFFDLAKSVNTGLRRIAKGSEALFSKEFAYAGRHTLKINAKMQGTKLKEVSKVVDNYNDKLLKAKHAVENRAKWRKNSDYKQFVEPIIKKFHESYWNGEGTYHPTLAEAQNLAWVLESFRAQGLDDTFRKPIQRMLSDFGFKFRKKKLIVSINEKGDFEFTPKDAHLMNRHRQSEPIITQAHVKTVTDPAKPYSPVTVRERVPEGEMDQRIRDREKRNLTQLAEAKRQVEADRHVRASAMFTAFRKVVDNNKSTKDRLIDAEEKLLEDLKVEGFVKMLGSEFATITVPGRPTITFRRSAKALAEGRIDKKQARKRMSAIRKSYTKPMYQYESISKANVANLSGTQTTSKDFDWVYKRLPGFQLRNIEHRRAHTTAANRVHALLNKPDKFIKYNVVLDEIIGALPAIDPLRQVAESLRAANVKRGGIGYNWGGFPWAPGWYMHEDGRSRIDFEYYNRLWAKGDKYADIDFLHTVLHETAHAATVEGIQKDEHARQMMFEVMDQAILEFARKSKHKITGRTVIDQRRLKNFNRGKKGEWRFKNEEDYAKEMADDINLQDKSVIALARQIHPGTTTWEVIIRKHPQPYAFTNIDEFVAEAFTNPDIQKFLKETKIDKTRTLWQRLVRTVMDIMGIKDAELETLWDAFMSATPTILKYRNKYTPIYMDSSWDDMYDLKAPREQVDKGQVRYMKKHKSKFDESAGQVADLLLDGPRSADTILKSIIDTVPENSPFGITARKLAALPIGDVTVSFDWEGKAIKDKEVLGRYRGSTRQAFIAPKKAQGWGLLHTVLHELTHAATQTSLIKDGRMRMLLEEVRSESLRQYRKQFGEDAKLPYGLRDDVPVDEFVAEMFSNEAFQTLSKQIQLDSRMSMWEEFKMLVRNLLGWTEPRSISAYDLVMELSPQLFRYADLAATESAPDLDMRDSALYDKGMEVFNKLNQTYEVERRSRKAATVVGSAVGRGKLSHAFHTMRQLRERYEKHFGGEKGPLARYMNAFNARNARNAELMQLPEKMSREWTKLTDKFGVQQAQEFSRIATEATIHMLDPSKLSTHTVNKKSALAQPGKFAELQGRFNKLPQEYKNLWSDVTGYYQKSLEEETALMMVNALRGIVTSGSGAMPVEVFNRKYNKDNIFTFAETQDKIIAEFGDYLGDTKEDMASLVQRLANVPAMKQGVYFPLMRYGEYAVYAKRTLPKKYFADNKAAYKFIADTRAGDPTLSAQARKEEDGRWSVEITETEFVVGETITQVMEERDRLVAKYGEENVGDVGRKLEMPKESTIGSNAALSSIIDSLEGNAAAQNAIKQFYLRNLSDQSFRKREIKRQNRRGADYDLQHRNFANYAKQSAYYRSQLQYGGEMATAMADMAKYLKGYKAGATGLPKEQLDNVYLTLKKRDELTTNPIEMHDLVRKGIALTQFYMLTSASYHMINMTQPWMVTLPTMGGRHGWGNALSAMKGAQGLIKAPIFRESKGAGFGFKLLPWLKGADTAAERAFGVFDDLVEDLRKNDSRSDEHIAMLERLRKSHVLEVSPLTELREIASGKTNWQSKVLDASRVMAHMVEVNNRVLTAIAAYDLEYAMQKNKGAGEEAARAAATEYAEDMVSQTQFDYSTANKPPAFMRLPIVFQFMQWSQHIYAHLIRNFMKAMGGDKDAQKILFGVLGTHAAVGGVIGVALQPIKMAFGFAMMAFGDDDEPYTFKNAMSGDTFDRVFTGSVNDLFGTEVSTVLGRGLPAALGFDLSTRMSVGTTFFIDLRGDTPEGIAGSLLSSFGGAGVNQMLTFGRGIQYAGSGDYAKAIEAFSPKFLRDIIRSGRFAMEGLVNNSGDTVLDTSRLGFYDVALQAIGFTPTKVGMFYEGQAAIKDKESFVRDRKIELMKQFRTADPGERVSIIDTIVEFNQSFPQEAITRSALLRNLKGRLERELQYERYGAAIDDKKAALYQGYGEPYR